jgi:hypothetical protein
MKLALRASAFLRRISYTSILSSPRYASAPSQLHAHVKSSASPSKSRTTSSFSPSNRRDAGSELILQPAALPAPARRSPLPTSTQNRSQLRRRWMEPHVAARCRPPHLHWKLLGVVAICMREHTDDGKKRDAQTSNRQRRRWGWMRCDSILSSKYPSTFYSTMIIKYRITYKSFWREKDRKKTKITLRFS